MTTTDTTPGKETLGFATEVRQLLHLMIHSLYGNREIFLRELVSNGSDACDRLRFAALDQPDLYEGDGELAIDVAVTGQNMPSCRRPKSFRSAADCQSNRPRRFL